MSASPLVSVVIPAYNNAEYLGDAIKSVLNQTYQNFELIVVNDASPDHADQVVKSFKDVRIKYVVHERNQGLSAARNSGIRSSTGDYVALLDGDDFFHPDKLRLHVEYLDAHPDVDVSYNPRFELNHSSKTIRDLWRPPLKVALSDLILGYPFAPSDMVIRRECLFSVDLFDKTYTYYGEDLDINCKLAISGYRFASVDRALNYRSFHSRRVIKNLRSYQEDELRPLSRVFSDPRCPASLLPLKNKALSNRYLGWSIFAYLQEDTDLGQEYILKAVELDPSLLDGKPCELLENFINFCVLDDQLDHDVLIRRLLMQLPDEFSWLACQAAWAVARAYLIKGVRAVMWDRTQDGKLYFAKALSSGAKIDDLFLRRVSAQLNSYESEFGAAATKLVIDTLAPLLEGIGSKEDVSWLKGCYSINVGFKNYAVKKYTAVPPAIFHAVLNDPSYLLNRGVIKIFVISLMRLGRKHYAF